jgi:hypothetical protein
MVFLTSENDSSIIFAMFLREISLYTSVVKYSRNFFKSLTIVF